MLKALGQNFLKNDLILQDIADAASLTKGDLVLEIGPGLGVLTQHLIAQAGAVLAVELDERLIPVLRGEFGAHENFRVEHANILDLSNEELLQKLQELAQHNGVEADSYKVVANIPYNITSPIIRKFTEQLPAPAQCVLMVQKEVAQRVAAPAGKMSILGVAAQFYTDAEYLQTVGAQEFLPPPKVDSAVLRLTRHSRHEEYAQSLGVTIDEVFRVVRVGFSSRRKQLHKNLATVFGLDSATLKQAVEQLGVPVTARAQELTIMQWIDLSAYLQNQ